MKLEDKYPTLQQSKRIAELLGDGAPKCDVFWYRSTRVEDEWILTMNPEKHDWNGMSVRAHDLAELGEMIMKMDGRSPAVIHTAFDPKTPEWIVDGYGLNYCKGDAEAQARAALLIHLLEAQQ